jgi:hypothetical protein
VTHAEAERASASPPRKSCRNQDPPPVDADETAWEARGAPRLQK